MKKLLFFALIVPFAATAQLGILGDKNIIKTNLSGDVIGNYNLTYERSVAKKLSLSVGVRYMPKVSMPKILQDKVVEMVGDNNIKIEEFKMGNFAITPELRLYLSLGKMKGFYIAPYLRYASFDVTVPVTYDYAGSTTKPYALFNGIFTSISGGLMIGTQVNIAKRLVLDFWILGAHYGTSNGTITATDFNPPMSATGQKQALQDKLDEISKESYGPFKFKGQFDGQTATLTSEGAWAGIRGAGICLGVRF